MLNFYLSHPQVSKLLTEFNDSGQKNFCLKGLLGSSAAMILFSILDKIAKTQIVILNDKEEAAFFYTDLMNLSQKNGKILFFPASYKYSVSQNAEVKIDNAGILSRTEVLNLLINNNLPHCIVTYPEAILENVVTKNTLVENTLKFKVDEQISLEFVTEMLEEYGFRNVDFVYEPGQFAVRGSIIDIFSFANELPYRIDFFGETVESIRTFDILSQLSNQNLSEVSIIPNIQNHFLNEIKQSFFEFIPQNSLIWLKDWKFCEQRIDFLFQRYEISQHLDNDNDEIITLNTDIISSGQQISEFLQHFSKIEFGTNTFFKNFTEIIFNTSVQPTFNKNFDILSEHFFEKQSQHFQIYILSENEKQLERLKSIFSSSEVKHKISFSGFTIAINEGFIDNDLKICCYTDHQIFNRYHKFQLKNNWKNESRELLTLNEIHDLQPGDFVVHIDHGVGKFGGLEKISVNGKMQETIKLVYQDNDTLYISIHSLHKIAKYKSKDGTQPKIYKLGSGAWEKLKQNAKKRVQDIARELIELYAKRKMANGFSFSVDSYLQEELEASFIYEDTPDQLKATIAVKQDMESKIPMDRLICGDVGFGKTEIAVRAAFKAVADNKQVAILVPTTILALQHFKTFSERLKNFPCTVDYISRSKTMKQQNETLQKIAEGKVDILIGTHRLLSQDVKFKDLGLLVIDEEQKFGVSMKEKLKYLKTNVDTLTLTATPIPRTLQFSLMGVRDLSIITTPPPNRFPIVTELHTFNDEIIKEAILYEIQRNGQIFFIHNRVANINEIEELIHRLCPNVSAIVAHGQMDGAKLEKIMLDFVDEKYDVLICTTIIESGVDIPNVNTIIINDAHHFGLSDLHQLRGRVGRGNKKAFCYLLTSAPTLLSQESRRRLKTIEEFTELGSGFNIALHDLDLRGSGNLLGGEQSGFIADIGFQTYHRILDETILELRETEYKSLFENQEETENSDKLNFVTDCQVDTDLEILFPDTYIENITERVKLYRELDSISNEEHLETFKKQLQDRFGDLPSQSQELLEVVQLRWKAMKMGIEKIILKNGIMILYFVSNPESLFYQSAMFQRILTFVQRRKDCRMKETNSRLSLTVERIKDVKTAFVMLQKMENG